MMFVGLYLARIILHYHITSYPELNIADIIKKYNPDVKGYSVRTGKQTSSNARNNVAISGAKAM